MACSNGCNCSGNCGSMYGTGYARRNNNSWYRNSYAALNTIPSCTRARNYPYYTGKCPDACGCYQCGCTAGVTNQNYRCGYGRSNNCSHCCVNNCGGCCDHMPDCGCGTCDSCHDNCCDLCDPCDNCNNCNSCGCDNNNCGCGCEECSGCTVCTVCRHCHDRCTRPVYGLFNASTPLAVTAGAAIPLTVNTTSCNDFTVSNGTVTINRCGTYLATYTVNIPSGAEIDTSIVMNVNGIAQSSTLLNISADGSYTGQTVFKANAGSTVSLVSNAAFSITDPVGQNVISLTLTRID